jgi:nucleoside-diphosphate-sugar epimerase
LKNIFVTGGSSYLGKNVLKGLPNFNYYSLESANNSSEEENIRIVDKTCLENLGKLFKDEKIEFVFHFASVYRKNPNTNDLLEMFDININLGNKIIQAANSTNVKKIISANSLWQDIFTSSNHFYTLTKNIYEDFQNNENNHFSSCSLHLGDVYGSDDHREKLITFLLKNENEKIIYFDSDGEDLFFPIHVNDINRQISRLLENHEEDSQHENKYLVNNVMKIKDFIELFRKVRNKNFEPIFNTDKKNKPKYDFDFIDTIKENKYSSDLEIKIKELTL